MKRSFTHALRRMFSDRVAVGVLAVGVLINLSVSQGDDLSPPDPQTNPSSGLLLNLRQTGTDPSTIRFSKLPRIPAEHAVISDVRDQGGNWVHQHAYVVRHEDRYWAMWSDGPGYSGKGLSLEAFRWNADLQRWDAHGTVFDDSLNNFPPKRLPSGDWMMTRRDHQRQVSVLIGSVKSFDHWRIRPLASYDGQLLIAFSGAKQTMEVLKVSLDEVDRQIAAQTALKCPREGGPERPCCES